MQYAIIAVVPSEWHNPIFLASTQRVVPAKGRAFGLLFHLMGSVQCGRDRGKVAFFAAECRLRHAKEPLASCQRATFVMLKCLFVTAECHFRHAKEPLLSLLQQSSVSRLAMSRSRGVCRAWRYMRHDLPRVLTFSTASISAVESSVLPNVAMNHCCQAKKLNASSVKNVRQ